MSATLGICRIGIAYSTVYTVRGPQDSVQLVTMTTTTMVYGRQINIVRWDYKPTYHFWGAHIVGIVYENENSIVYVHTVIRIVENAGMRTWIQ